MQIGEVNENPAGEHDKVSKVLGRQITKANQTNAAQKVYYTVFWGVNIILEPMLRLREWQRNRFACSSHKITAPKARRLADILKVFERYDVFAFFDEYLRKLSG